MKWYGHLVQSSLMGLDAGIYGARKEFTLLKEKFTLLKEKFTLLKEKG